MKPCIAIVGRPNVGKSTLFNRLTKSRDALVADRPGVTRDRQFGITHHADRSFLVVDTGGMGEDNHDSQELASLMTKQTIQAATKASLLIWVMDGQAGLTAVDEQLANGFRRLNKPLFLAVNKLEGRSDDSMLNDFFQLGIEPIFLISSKRGDGVAALMDSVATELPVDQAEEDNEKDKSLVLALLGRPNVGKSTLVNRILGEYRVLTFDYPGTTRDSIRIPFERNGKSFSIIDTAGVRRKSRIDDTVEKFSVIKSLDAITQARIMIIVIDATEGVTEQDASLLSMIEQSGKPIIIAINKWDGINDDDKRKVKAQIERKFVFADYAEYQMISALHGTGVGNIFKTITRIEKSLTLSVNTADLTCILEDAVNTNPPMMIRGRRIKLRYAHLGGHDPVRIIIHGNQTERIPQHYTRYLAKVFRKALQLVATPVIIIYKHGDNPYKGRKNKLASRQENKRKRMMRYVKKK